MAVIDDYVAARKAGDFKVADAIRAKMRAEGIVLEVKRDGTVRQRPMRLRERPGCPQNAERLPVDPRGGSAEIVVPGATSRNGAG